MKNIITQLGMLSVVALMLGSCAKGPSGPDPGSELVITYPIGNIGQTRDAAEDVRLCDLWRYN